MFGGTQLFRSTSLRTGGHVSDIKFVETSINVAIRPQIKLIELDRSPFSFREEKFIKYNFLVELLDTSFNQQPPPFNIKFQFLDHNGATIPANDNGKPYTLNLSIK